MWRVLQFLLTLWEVFLCYKMCDALLEKREGKSRLRKCAVMAGCFAVAGMLSYNRECLFFSNTICIFVIVTISLLLFIYFADKKGIVCIVINYFLLVTLVDYLFMILVMFFVKECYWKQIYLHMGLWRIITLSLTRITAFIVYINVKKKLGKVTEDISSIFILTIITEIIAVRWFQGYFWEYESFKAVRTVILLIAFLLLIIALVAVYLKGIEVREQSNMLEIKNVMLEENYSNLQQVYVSNQYLCHDFKNHLVVLRRLLVENRYREMEAYLNDVAKPINRMNSIIWSDCTIVNLILNIKSAEAEDKGVKTVISIGEMDWDRYEEKDLVVIFSNLLDNAIEACGKMERKRKWITVDIHMKNAMTVIKVENSAFECPKRVNGEFVSTKIKREIHGYGIKSVQSIVEKYGGTGEWKYAEGVFSVCICFFE